MAAVSVVESEGGIRPQLVDDPGEVEAIRLFRRLTPEQQKAMLALAEAMVRPRLAPWHGHKPGRA